VLLLTRKVKDVREKFLMGNHYPSSLLFSHPHNRKINSCSAVHYRRKGMPTNLGTKTLKLEKGDIMCKVKGGISVAKTREECIFLPTCTTSHVDEKGDASKLLCVEIYN
jgi:hypothetical protein